jgi:flagellar motor component MotA
MKKLLTIIFLTFCVIFVIIANLFNTGYLSINWAYFGVVIAYIGVAIAIYGFVTQALPKFKSMYERWFKKEEKVKKRNNL